MTYHALFPTMLLEINNPDHAPIKQSVEKNYYKWIQPNKLAREVDGVNTVHHEKSFEPIYRLAVAAARQYIIGLAIDPDRFDYYVAKSWFSILHGDDLQPHTHADSHFGFVYYVNIPEGRNTPLDFHHREGRYEPHYLFAEMNKPAQFNQFNSYTWSFTPKEGDMIIFPGNLPHSVRQRADGEPKKTITSFEEYKTCRVCIAGDILLIFKQKTALDMGLQPISQWRKFE